MGVKSYGGAVGNYIFVDACSGDCTSMLYSSKAQFPDLLERVLIGVLALQYVVRIVRLDGDAVNISARVEMLASEYGFVLQPMSAGSPQENALAEKAVADVTRLARAFMLGAPHLKANRWGSGFKYADKVNSILPKPSKNGRTPYEIIHKRVPDMDRMCIRVFGCPVQFKPLHTSNVKMHERTIDGYFLGVDAPSMLIERVEVGKKVKMMRISPKKVRCHEGAYCETPYVSMDRLEHLVTIDDDGEQEIPVTVPSIKVLKPGALYDPLDNQGESEPQVYKEEHEEIVQQSSVDKVRELKEDLLGKQDRPDLQEGLVDILEGRQESPRGTTQERSLKMREERFREDETRGVGARLRTRSTTPKHTPVMQPSQTGNAHSPTHDREVGEELACLRPPVSSAPVGSRVMIESTRFDGDTPGSYSNTADTFTQGTLVKRLRGGMVEVLWDGDAKPVKSHWTHIMYAHENLAVGSVPGPPQSKKAKVGEVVKTVKTSMVAHVPGQAYDDMQNALALPPWHEPLHILALVARATIAEHEGEDVQHDNMPVQQDSERSPRNALEALVTPQWRKWFEAIRKEHGSWVESNAFEVTQREDMLPGSKCVDIHEIYSIKRDGTHKFRPVLMGNQLRKDIDYKATFSGTVTADSIRFFFSLATSMNKQVHGGDVKCAYLNARQRIPIYAYLPSYWDLVDLTWEKLGEIRRTLRKLIHSEGTGAFRRLVKSKRRSSRRVIRLLASVYGTPDAGNAWGLLLIHVMTVKLGFTRSSVDGCIYFKTNKVLVPKENDVDTRWTTEYIVVLTWTDDMPYFGTSSMIEEYEREIVKHLPMVFKRECTDFISIEIKQDLVRGVTELTQAKYWLGAAVRYKEYLALPNRVRSSLPEGTKLVPATAEEHELAKHLPYRELVGTMAFPSCHTKLEIRYAISQLSAHMQRWNLEHWGHALHCLKYCINSRDIGLMYSRGLDVHGTNVLYAYMDAAFTAPYSQGCRSVMNNGAAISMSSQKHSTVDCSTTGAELTEAFLASNDVMGFRNLMTEMGFELQGPTVMYEDNQPAIAVAESNRNLASKTKHMEIRVWKLRERIDDEEVCLRFCSTHDMQADIGTKALGVGAFEYLRDLQNGYALVRLMHPDYGMSVMCVSHQELETRISRTRAAGGRRP
jgi:hypothetical protein